MKKPSNFVDSVYELYENIHMFLKKTPMLKQLNDDGTDNGACFLKCENLQYTHSFKYRGAFAAIFLYQKHHPDIWNYILSKGLTTCSTGNFAAAAANITHELRLNFTVIVHDWVDTKKIETVLKYNPKTEVINVSLQEWQDIVTQGSYLKSEGFFLSTVLDDFVTLGNATLGIEILQQLPNIESIVIPYGGGNLTYSLARFLKAIKPAVKIYTVEVNSGAPFSASFEVGVPVNVHYQKTFIDGIGASFVIPKQFDRVKPLVKEALVVTPKQIAEAVVQLAVSNDTMVVEGAGAASLAAYRHYSLGEQVCCVLSGGNIDPNVLSHLIENTTLEGVTNE